MIEPTPAFLDLARVRLPVTHVGCLRGFAHSRPADRVWRLAHHKRWYYVAAATDEVFVAASVVHLGYVGKVFVYVADRRQGRMLWQRSVLLPPGPWLAVDHEDDGAGRARARTPGLSVGLIKSADGGLSLTARATDLALELALTPKSPAIVAATFLPSAATNLTEKALGLVATGGLRVGDRRITFSDALGGFDYTNGYLPRHTKWKWAHVLGRARSGEVVGVNLVQGFNGACECVLVADDQVEALGEGRITMDRALPMQPWTIATTCGRVTLTLTPFALHREDTNVGVAHARFLQPIGVYSGTLRRQNGHELIVDSALGVAEDQDVLW